jgi:hypothetical protein
VGGGAEFVERGVEAGLDKAAVASGGGRFGHNGGAKFFGKFRKGVKAVEEAGKEFRGYTTNKHFE